MNPETKNEAPCWLDEFMIGQPMPRGGYYILPWGDDNFYSQMIRQITRENGLLQNILVKHQEMLWGDGAQLYVTGFVNGRRRKRWVSDPEIESWLESWNYRDYLEKVMVEFLLLNGYFTKFHCITKPFARLAVEKLEFISCDLARLQYTSDDDPISGVIIGDYTKSILFGYDRLPLFDPENPRAHERSISFESIYQSGVEYYPRSPIHSSLSWIQAGAQTAGLIAAFNANSISPKYHIEVPELYWVLLREKLISECQANGTIYNEAMLLAAKNQTFEEVSTVLSGIDKVGKFLVTELLRDELHEKYVGWKIISLDTKIRDYFSAQMKVARESQFNLTAGLGMHPALSGVKKEGGLSSGSELMVAAKLYKNISTDISEKIILKNLNVAIAINFTGSKTKLGFNHDNI